MRPDRLYLEDIVGAAEAVGRFLAGVDRERFLADELLQSAVLHQLMIVGEAAGRVSEVTKEANLAVQGDRGTMLGGEGGAPWFPSAARSPRDRSAPVRAGGLSPERSEGA